jgi:hypothetical protein
MFFYQYFSSLLSNTCSWSSGSVARYRELPGFVSAQFSLLSL